MDNNTQTTDPQDVEGTWGPVSDVLRRNAEYMKAVGRNLWRDPVGTYFPHAGSVGAALKEIPAFVSDLAPRNNNVPGNSYFTPNNPNILFQVGILYAAQNDFANAALALKAAVDANPQFANARYFLSAVYMKLGNTASRALCNRAGVFRVGQHCAGEPLEHQLPVA